MSFNDHEINIFLPLSHSWDPGPTGSDLGPFHKTKRTRMTSSVTQDGVLVPVFRLLNFYSFKRMNYALLEFLDVNRANVFAIYMFGA